MDEILIEEKKYVSSKQAAKLTGYAKDYIGQLCREGRVPARLVGRSWYVLESAIHDHRFGNPEPVQEKEQEVAAALAPAGAFPRYEAVQVEVLPSINLLRETSPEDREVSPVPQQLQDSWQAWFENVGNSLEHAAFEEAAPVSSVPQEPVAPEPVEEAAPEVESGAIGVPLHALENRQVAEKAEHISSQPKAPAPAQRGRRAHPSAVVVLSAQCLEVLVAFLGVFLAVAGSGYIDSFILSNERASMVAGVAVYER